MSTTDVQIARTGDALQRAWRADLAGRRRPRRIIGLAVALLVIGCGVAAGASLLKSPAEEQASILAGTTLFQGSDPTCVQVSDSAYRCTLAASPTGETFFDAQGRQVTDVFLGMKAETVNANHRVDGGCISRSVDGTLWACYLGRQAVARGVIDARLLGAYSQEPAAG